MGKKPDSPITADAIAKGNTSGDPHVLKMATIASNSKNWH